MKNLFLILVIFVVVISCSTDSNDGEEKIPSKFNEQIGALNYGVIDESAVACIGRYGDFAIMVTGNYSTFNQNDYVCTIDGENFNEISNISSYPVSHRYNLTFFTIQDPDKHWKPLIFKSQDSTYVKLSGFNANQYWEFSSVYESEYMMFDYGFKLSVDTSFINLWKRLTSQEPLFVYQAVMDEKINTMCEGLLIIEDDKVTGVVVDLLKEWIVVVPGDQVISLYREVYMSQFF